MLTSSQVHDLTIRLLKVESERDKQRNVGASQISDPCTYHLAKALTNAEEAPQKYWLGAKIGTGVHMLIEDSISKADIANFPELEGCVVEKKINLGELPGYGLINSKPDLMMVKHNHLIDWKTSTREKMRKMQRVLLAIENGEPIKNMDSYYTLQKYMAQTALYAMGLIADGQPVEGISIVFINRDGTNEADSWNHTFEYDADFAKAIWTRLENLWAKIQSGVDIETLTRNENCYKCSIGI